MLFSLICSNSLAHGGNIKGWKDKNSQYIVEHEGKYYGYHNGVKIDFGHESVEML